MPPRRFPPRRFTAYGDDNFVVAAPAGADKSGEASGAVAIAWRTDELSAQAAALRNTVLATLAVGLLAIITMIVLVLRRLVEHLNDVAQRIRALAEGDMDAPVPSAARSDEIDRIADAVTVM